MPRKPISFSRAPKLTPGRSASTTIAPMPLRSGLVVEPRVDEVVVGLAAVGDPALRPVDRVRAVGQLGPSRHVGRRRARVRLGDRDCHRRVTGDDLRQEPGLQLLAAEQGQHPGGAGVGLEHLERGRAALLGQLLDHDQRVPERCSAAAEALRQADSEQPERAEVLALGVRERLAVGVPSGRLRGVALLRERARQGGELRCVLARTRPEPEPVSTVTSRIS